MSKDVGPTGDQTDCNSGYQSCKRRGIKLRRFSGSTVNGSLSIDTAIMLSRSCGVRVRAGMGVSQISTSRPI